MPSSPSIPTSRLLKFPAINSRITILAAALASAQLASAATLIVAENFGGSGANLDGTTAETFAGGITTAGGSNTRVAAAPFNDDGSLVDGNNHSAYLNRGSYIHDTRKGACARPAPEKSTSPGKTHPRFRRPHIRVNDPTPKQPL